MAREQRKLAAILAADVVGYSRLMGRHEPDRSRDRRGNCYHVAAKSHRFEHGLNFRGKYRVHDNDDVGPVVAQILGRDNFLRRSRHESPGFPRIDVNNVLDAIIRSEPEHVEKADCLGTSAP